MIALAGTANDFKGHSSYNSNFWKLKLIGFNPLRDCPYSGQSFGQWSWSGWLASRVMPANESSASFLFLFSRIRDALFTSCELIFMRYTGVWGPSNCSPGFKTASEPAVSWHWLKHLCDKACTWLDPNWCPNKSKNKATTKEVPMPPPKTAHSFLSPGSWMHMKLCSLDQGGVALPPQLEAAFRKNGFSPASGRLRTLCLSLRGWAK